MHRITETYEGGEAMSLFSGPPIEIAKYTDSELVDKLDDVRKNIADCESYERWKPSLVAEQGWIQWELDRRKKAEAAS